MRSIPERESIPARRVDSWTLRSKFPLWPSAAMQAEIRRPLLEQYWPKQELAVGGSGQFEQLTVGSVGAPVPRSTCEPAAGTV